VIPLHDDNPTRTTPYVTIGIIIVSVLVFFWELSLGRRVELAVYSLGMTPAVAFGGKQLMP